jgi:hypothetical protein
MSGTSGKGGCVVLCSFYRNETTGKIKSACWALRKRKFDLREYGDGPDDVFYIVVPSLNIT